MSVRFDSGYCAGTRGWIPTGLPVLTAEEASGQSSDFGEAKLMRAGSLERALPRNPLRSFTKRGRPIQFRPGR